MAEIMILVNSIDWPSFWAGAIVAFLFGLVGAAIVASLDAL